MLKTTVMTRSAGATLRRAALSVVLSTMLAGAGCVAEDAVRPSASGGAGAGGGSSSGGSTGLGGTGAGTGGNHSAGTGIPAGAGGTPGGSGSSGMSGAFGTGGSSGSGGVAGGGSGGGAGGPSETLHYSGRWNVQGGGKATTVNSGSYVIASFTGTAIAGTFDTSVNDPTDMPTVAWRVDDAAEWNVAEVAPTLSMGSNLSAGMHTITVIARGLDENKNRWSPPLTSSITFLGFEVTGGALLETARAAQPKLEIFGDSITEGVVVQGDSYMGHSGQCWKNDAVYSYPTQTGMMLNADYRQVGFGYQGLLKTGDGGVPAANDSFPWIYEGVPRDDWQPDLVVINQGTNDGSKPAATFRAAYTTFLTTIRSAYPNAKLVALRPFNGAQAAEIQAAVTAANTAGDQRVYYVDTTGWLGNGDFVDGLHPNVQGSGKAATALVAAIEKIGFP
jgi:lysophospholipase L1-like esterase